MKANSHPSEMDTLIFIQSIKSRLNVFILQNIEHLQRFSELINILIL